MSEYLEVDVNGDGVDDAVVVQEYADGSMISVADVDGDNLPDIAAYDANSDGVPEAIYDASTGEYSTGYDPGTGEQPTGASPDPYATDYGSDAGEPATESTSSYADASFYSDMLRIQHETNMAIIDNIA